MKRILRLVLLALLLPAGLLPVGALATDTGSGGTPSGFVPGLGDLMTMSVQPRHIKLGLAGRAGNWVYAMYEVGELREALEDVTNMQPTWDGKPIATMLRAETDKPLRMLEAAIKNRDAAGFAKAYDGLTAGCNQCHTNAGKPEVVIQVPTVSAYPDQVFSPRKP